MAISQLSQDELIVQSRQAIGNALADPVIQGYLAEWGYTTARLQEGQALLDTAVRLSNVKMDEFGDQKNATYDKGLAWEEADREYMKLLKVARVAVKRPGDRTKLHLDGDREQNYAGWWQQANDFYTQSLDNPEILAQLAEFNLTPVKLQAGQALLNKVDAARAQQTSQKGAAQNITAERTAAS